MQRAGWIGLLFFLSISLTACSGDDTPATVGDGGVDLGPIPDQLQRYIRADTHTRLVFEVDYVDGFEPYADTGDELAAGLEDMLDKPDGIELQLDEVIEGKGDQAWTREELYALADSTENLEVPADTVKIHVLFLDGEDEESDGDGTILGLAWDHIHIVMYKQSIESACAGYPLFGPGLCEAAEVSILTHEVGHTLGLVDNGLPMVTDHKDPDHGPHDSNDGCVMYWAYEGEAAIDVLSNRLGSNPDATLGFDQECLDDVAAVRNAN
ncbi:MAG: hypothetical protein ACOCXM_02955 [Myxococcota bacterium]